MRLHSSIVLLCCAWLFAVVNCQNVAPAPPPGGYYTTRYDHLDIERILNQKRLVHYYSECLLERGPCTPQGIEFKRILPEALRTNCLRCSEKQRFVTLKSIKRLKKEYPDVWAELAAIWDPTGEYVQKLEDSLNKKNYRSPEIQQSPVSPSIQSNSNQIQSELIPQPNPSQQVPIFTRFDNDDVKPNVLNVPNVQTLNVQPPTQISEGLPSPKPQIQTAANTIANKPISFSSTTNQPIVIISPTTTKATPILSSTTNSFNTIKTTTKRIFTTILQDRIPVVPTTPGRISYNYDFAATVKPIHQLPVTGINMVIKGVNTIIQPITDIAGRVITAGTDIAGIVLNALGVRRTY